LLSSVSQRHILFDGLAAAIFVIDTAATLIFAASFTPAALPPQMISWRDRRHFHSRFR